MVFFQFYQHLFTFFLRIFMLIFVSKNSKKNQIKAKLFFKLFFFFFDFIFLRRKNFFLNFQIKIIFPFFDFSFFFFLKVIFNFLCSRFIQFMRFVNLLIIVGYSESYWLYSKYKVICFYLLKIVKQKFYFHKIYFIFWKIF